MSRRTAGTGSVVVDEFLLALLVVSFVIGAVVGIDVGTEATGAGAASWGVVGA